MNILTTIFIIKLLWKKSNARIKPKKEKHSGGFFQQGSYHDRRVNKRLEDVYDWTWCFTEFCQCDAHESVEMWWRMSHWTLPVPGTRSLTNCFINIAKDTRVKYTTVQTLSFNINILMIKHGALCITLHETCWKCVWCYPMKCVRLHLSCGWTWSMWDLNRTPHVSISTSRSEWLQSGWWFCVNDKSTLSAAEETQYSITASHLCMNVCKSSFMRDAHLTNPSSPANSLLTETQWQVQ